MSDNVLESINPATERVVATTRVADGAAIEQALQRVEAQAASWARSVFSDRRSLLMSIADELESGRERLAALVTTEMGKLIDEARAEVEKCAWVCRYYAEQADTFLADDVIDTGARRTLVAYQPLGAVLAIMPWNFPLWQVFRFAAPAVAAGNVAVLKHAANVAGCGAAVEEVFRRAGAPAGLFTNLPIRSSQVARLIDDRRIRAVTLTGSEPAGRDVAARAGKALKKSVLELGGSDPFVVLDDADMELAVRKAVQSRFMNAGQSCIAAKRFIVVEAVAETFEQRLAEAASALRPGDPMAEETTLAPMARADLRDAIHSQVTDAIDKGAQTLAGGRPVAGQGFFYEPTVLGGITGEMRAYSEELFGPVASILRATDERHALQIANDSDFGLGGSVWTGDRERGQAFARQLACGSAFVNELVKSDPRVPFGGIKTSGYGRELSRQGIHEFVNAKTIWVD